MGKVTGFLEYQRKKPTEESVKTRIKHYREFARSLDEADLADQGARCMDCGIPFCHSSFGCPVLNLIPEWNDFVYRKQWQEAFERLEATNNFPEITGRVCPAPCESACTLSINDSPVTIKQIELQIIERAFKEGWVIPYPPTVETGKSVAIIGSGPAGLAAAQQLRRKGHQVTIFEKSPKIGGLLRYGIPDFKLEKWVLDRRLDQLTAEGVNFNTDVEIGEDLSARYLQKSFDVIIITTGAGQPRNLEIPGRELDGIYFAMDFLTKNNLYMDGLIQSAEVISAKNKNVIVIGGGDTGSDCVGTANRHGAKSVTQFEILPQPREWKESWNPEWPYWPNILRTSSSHEEGCERDWSILTKSFLGENGQVRSAEFCRIDWKTDSDGRQTLNEIPNSEFKLDVDLVLLATGFVHVEHNKLLKDLDLKFDDRNNIRIDSNYMTSVDGVFAAGDAQTGASLIVRAIYHGRQAAKSVDAYLKR
ncbi:MAG: glutamate synthase subunit beta [Calditrichaceae bacterium]|nr:glutamate synthase subunit beta [Calditrichaceae bacterium]HES60065.1 glutamate synthase subunit beta [Caldithrix sp.]